MRDPSQLCVPTTTTTTTTEHDGWSRFASGNLDSISRSICSFGFDLRLANLRAPSSYKHECTEQLPPNNRIHVGITSRSEAYITFTILVARLLV